jgi:hypothetical protein
MENDPLMKAHYAQLFTGLVLRYRQAGSQYVHDGIVGGLCCKK